MPKSTNPLAQLFDSAKDDVQDAAAETLAKSYSQFLASNDGKALVAEARTTVIWYTAIPVALAAFGLGYYLATTRST